MKLYRTNQGNLLQWQDRYYMMKESWDELINRNALHQYLVSVLPGCVELQTSQVAGILEKDILCPSVSQEVWAAGVTYLRSRDARMEESKQTGGASLYDMVYEAARPELFFKASPHRVAGHGQQVYIRKDSVWSVPEPELTLFINSAAQIQGYTIGNDMSSRSIEGENPLYLPQAKIYERSASLGPCLWITDRPAPPDTTIEMTITRKGTELYRDHTAIDRIKRSFGELVEYLYRESDFPHGCFLMTGTCLVPPDNFTLQEEDVVQIAISSIGTLVNTVAYKPR